jgi:protein-S-isoprenylcysteine O-methyltransferase Ste14
VWSGHLFGWPGIAIGTPILVIGAFLIVKGWLRIHKAFSRGGALVTDGIYRVVRHPQYLGLLLFTLGWLIHWPTIVGAAMWPLLALVYYRLAKREERELGSVFGEEYRRYRDAVPMFIPKSVKAVLLPFIKR